MPHRPAERLHTVRLDLNRSAGPGAPIRANLSVAERVGRTLFVASDEGASIERLVCRDDGSYGEHRSFRLADLFDLPAGAEGEVDIEGLSADDGWLWVTGSHSLARRKPKPDQHDADACLKRLTEVRRDPNRYLLGRIPLVAAGKDGVYDLGAADGARSAACLKMGAKRNVLAKRLRRDEHIGRFIEVPAKENGFDIEGVAARGQRVFLGLRGPVLRGWACILELKVRERKPGRLRLDGFGKDGCQYVKHFVDLDGLGIRELTFDADGSLLILAGPTMDLDGPVVLWRWDGALKSDRPTLVPRSRLTRVLDVPYGTGFDHAEGICCFEAEDGGPRLLVVYDNPGDDRLQSDGAGVEADVFALPTASTGVVGQIGQIAKTVVTPVLRGDKAG